MFTTYFIYLPFRLSDSGKDLRLVVTMGSDMMGIYRDKVFINNIAKDLKIKTPVTDFEIIPCRSYYYSEYIENENYIDVWTVVWIINLYFKEQIPALRIESDFPWIETDAVGSGDQHYPADKEDINCLIVGDFSSEKNLQSANSFISEEMKSRKEKGEIWIVKSKKLFQLFILLGPFPDSFFQKKAPVAAKYFEIIKRFNGEIHNDYR